MDIQIKFHDRLCSGMRILDRVRSINLQELLREIVTANKQMRPSSKGTYVWATTPTLYVKGIKDSDINRIQHELITVQGLEEICEDHGTRSCDFVPYFYGYMANEREGYYYFYYNNKEKPRPDLEGLPAQFRNQVNEYLNNILEVYGQTPSAVSVLQPIRRNKMSLTIQLPHGNDPILLMGDRNAMNKTWSLICQSKLKWKNNGDAFHSCSIQEVFIKRSLQDKRAGLELNNIKQYNKRCINNNTNMRMVKCYCCFTHKGSVYRVFERYDNDLIDYLNELTNAWGEETLTTLYLLFDRLYETFVKNNVSHTDISLENILVKVVGDKLHLCICDYEALLFNSEPVVFSSLRLKTEYIPFELLTRGLETMISPLRIMEHQFGKCKELIHISQTGRIYNN